MPYVDTSSIDALPAAHAGADPVRVLTARYSSAELYGLCQVLAWGYLRNKLISCRMLQYPGACDYSDVCVNANGRALHSIREEQRELNRNKPQVIYWWRMGIRLTGDLGDVR